LAFLSDDFWDISKTRAFNLLSRIFSERFRIKIREQLGLAYSAYAYNSPSFSYKDYGILHAVVSSKPSNIDKVLMNMQSIAESLSQKGVSIKELNLVKKPVLNHIKDMQKTNSYWLNSVLSGSFNHPEKFMWAKNVFDEYSSISKAMISQLANKYLNIDNSTIIIIKPKSIQ
jgi:zinc protease